MSALNNFLVNNLLKPYNVSEFPIILKYLFTLRYIKNINKQAILIDE